MAAKPLTRDLVRAMTVDEFAEREPEIMRWLAIGAPDGEPAPEVKRPDGHEFTRAEVAAMSLDEFEANAVEIQAQAHLLKQRDREIQP